MACSGDIEWCDAELTCLQEKLRIRQVWPGSVIVVVPTGNRGQYSVDNIQRQQGFSLHLSALRINSQEEQNQCILQPIFLQHSEMHCCPYNSGPISAEATTHIFKLSQQETDENQPARLLLRVANYLCVATFRMTSLNWSFLLGILIIYSQTLNNNKK